MTQSGCSSSAVRARALITPRILDFHVQSAVPICLVTTWVTAVPASADALCPDSTSSHLAERIGGEAGRPTMGTRALKGCQTVIHCVWESEHHDAEPVLPPMKGPGIAERKKQFGDIVD